MSNEFSCWKCNSTLVDVIMPMSRREECDKCGTDQHVCKMCVYYVRGRCEEERAEHISDTERANFCDYFKPSNTEFKPTDKQKSDKAKSQLAELFGDPIPEDDHSDLGLTPAQLAEKKLRELLNG